MSYYYQYQFISPEMIFATVKEELKSYFDTGAVDDLMFPTYVDKCLRKLGRSSYVIKPEMLYIEDFQARLPDNFYAVREAWLCTEIESLPFQTPNSFYSQTASCTVQVSPIITDGSICNNPSCTDPECCGDCQPEIIQAVYKTNYQTTKAYRRQYLLKPGNISVRDKCDVNYTSAWEFQTDIPTLHNTSPGSSTYDSFDIRDNKFVTNFRTGAVNLIFYATEYDEVGNQMIPDNYRIREFIEAFIKYKVFETLSNQTNDETFNQLNQKMLNYKQMADEAFIMASIEVKKQDVFAKQRRIRKDLNRFNMYNLPIRTNLYGRRRNN